MNVYIFTGPTLRPDEGRVVLDAVYLPPVAQGDVYRVALRSPLAIGIIDGYFERVPSVWHKEILWAMSRGIHVFGSASMGALRAVELAPFGMEGVGRIFDAYASGLLEGDDEVAVAHGEAEAGFAPLSEPMVNIRFTLERAEAEGVISPQLRATLERTARSLFYPERSFLRIMADAAFQVPPAALVPLRAWLPSGRVDQKREDALAMLRVMRGRLSAGLEPKRPDFSFEETRVWERARSLAGELQLAAEGGVETVLFDQIADELRLDGDAYLRAYQDAMLRSLALAEACRRGITASEDEAEAARDAFCRTNAGTTAEEVDRWLAEQGLSEQEFGRLMQEQATLRLIEGHLSQQALQALPDHLRISGEYSGRLARARDKARTLAARGLQQPTLAESGMTEERLLRWYWEERLGRPPPPDVARYAHAAGFESEDAFLRAVLREYCYVSGQSQRALQGETIERGGES